MMLVTLIVNHIHTKSDVVSPSFKTLILSYNSSTVQLFVL